MRAMWPLMAHEMNVFLAAHPDIDHAPDEVWRNDIYECFVYFNEKANLIRDDGEDAKFPEVIWLSIKRYDRQPIHDWRSLQQIKNDVVGKEHEAFELYPKESRLLDEANQFHLWVFRDKDVMLPVGQLSRRVQDTEAAAKAGATQRKIGINE